MAKSVLKNLLVSLLVLSLTACTIPPSYSRKNIDKVIKKICKEEYNIDVVTWLVKDTVWVYAPFGRFVDQEGGWDKKVTEDFGRIFHSLSRAFLNMEKPPKFYCFVASDVKYRGIDLYHIGFIPDKIKFDMGLISLGEREKRLGYIYFPNPQALDDTKGRHINKYNVVIEEFMALLIEQNMEKEFNFSKFANNYQTSSFIAQYQKDQIEVSFNIRIKKYKEGLPLVMEKTQEIVTKVIDDYAAFHGIKKVILKDNFNEKIKVLEFQPQSQSMSVLEFSKKPKLTQLRQVNYYLRRAEAYYSESDFRSAIEFYRKVLEVNPESSNAFIGLGTCFYALTEHNEAIDNFKKALALSPQYGVLHYNVALAYVGLGKYQKAVKHFNQCLKTFPDNPQAYHWTGVAYINLGQYEQAITSFKQAIKLDPNFSYSYSGLGLAHYNLQNYGQAITYYLKAIEFTPKDYDVYYQLGIIYATLSKPDEAIKYFDKAIKYKPDFASAYFGLGLAYQFTGKLREAKSNLEKAKELFKAHGNTVEAMEVESYLNQ